MAKFAAIIFAYMLSVSSAFASDDVAALGGAKNIFAEIIANDKGLKSENVRIIILKGQKELAAAKSGIRVLSLQIDDRLDNFFAKVSANNSAPFDVQGKFEKLRLVPVLARKMERDEVITSADIKMAPLNERIVKRGIVTDEKELIGKALGRTIQANRPVMPKSLVSPKLVQRNNIVTAIYKSEMMMLQDNAIALEDGSKGEVIRLKNVNSNRVIRGTITAANTVEITQNSQLLASN